MNSENNIKKFNLLIFSLFLLQFLGCQKREWKNPYDPNTQNSYLPVKNFGIEQVSLTQVNLTWEQLDLRIDGFVIDRRIETNDWQDEFVILDNKSTEWSDTSMVLDSLHHYRLYTYSGSSKSRFIEKNITPIIPAPSNLQINKFSPFNIKLIWQDNSNGEDGFKIDRKVANKDWELVPYKLNFDQNWQNIFRLFGSGLSGLGYGIVNNNLN